MNDNRTGGYDIKNNNVNARSPECKHNFFNILNDSAQRDINSVYTLIGCAWCGQIRKLHANGLVHVVVLKGSIKYEV